MEINELKAFIELMIECYRLSPEVAAQLLQNILNCLQKECEESNQKHDEKGK